MHFVGVAYPPNKISKTVLKMQAFYTCFMKFCLALNSYNNLIKRTLRAFCLQNICNQRVPERFLMFGDIKKMPCTKSNICRTYLTLIDKISRFPCAMLRAIPGKLNKSDRKVSIKWRDRFQKMCVR